jgi:hypothetical protein
VNLSSNTCSISAANPIKRSTKESMMKSFVPKIEESVKDGRVKSSKRAPYYEYLVNGDTDNGRLFSCDSGRCCFTAAPSFFHPIVSNDPKKNSTAGHFELSRAWHSSYFPPVKFQTNETDQTSIMDDDREKSIIDETVGASNSSD